MAVETTNFDDALKRIYQMVSQATLAPDADMDFATKLMMVIRGYLMKNAGAMAGPGPQGPPQGPPPGGGGMPPGMGGGGMGLSPEGGGMPPGAAGGMGMNPGGGGAVEMPNPDELRRILGGAVV